MPCCARAASRSFRRSPDLHFRTMETPTMTPDAFETSLRDPSPPPALGPALLALWHQGRGEWHAAHGAAQSDEGRAAAWVHAHPHPFKGDEANAGDGYRRARPIGSAAGRERRCAYV